MNMTAYAPPAETLRELINLHATEAPERAFVIFPETGICLSYADLQHKMLSYSRYFSALDLQPGDTVSFMMGNGLASLELFLATLYSGCITSPLNPAAGQDQI